MSAAVLQMPRNRGGRKPRAGRASFAMLPSGRGDPGAWLYACGLPDGRLKVGIAGQPRARIRMHAVTFEGLLWAHVFGRLPSSSAARAVERKAITLLSTVGRRVDHSECFRDIDKAEFLRVIRIAYAMPRTA